MPEVLLANLADIAGIPLAATEDNIAVFGATPALLKDGGSPIAAILARTAHTGEQAISTVTGLQDALDAADDSALAARANHTGEQAISTVTGLQAALDAKAPTAAADQNFIIACSDETTAITATAGKVEFRMPYDFTVTAVRASLTTAQASGSIFTVDIHENGITILSTKLTIDNTEKGSLGAVTQAVISDASLTDNSTMTIDVDQIGDGTAKGLKVIIIGTRA